MRIPKTLPFPATTTLKTPESPPEYVPQKRVTDPFAVLSAENPPITLPGPVKLPVTPPVPVEPKNV
jgi:hypothetical protein